MYKGIKYENNNGFSVVTVEREGLTFLVDVWVDPDADLHVRINKTFDLLNDTDVKRLEILNDPDECTDIEASAIAYLEDCGGITQIVPEVWA